MNFFSRRGSAEEIRHDRIAARIDTALETIFTKDGKRAVLYFLSKRYSLTLEEAGADPARLEAALTSLLGEIGWTVVRKRILEEFSTSQPMAASVSYETRSLGEVFGAFRLLLPSAPLG